ncbi:hypothetical protein O181_024365 [Austropuccinia psidii MF-1]|uniref:Uncharacterized protein n=1 Tax=Austropuccinia psidii MF-1 TaxID=1389203 RepID=A0A9Q3CKU5_9BASI|nr:hypothetical protein [Austropuccinia psidii MF-1]
MVSSHELGIEVESLSNEINPDPLVLPEYEDRFILNIFNLSNPESFLIAFISAQPPSSQKPNFKSYEKEKTVEPCAPTEDAGQDDVIFSCKVEIISKEQCFSNIAQKIPRLEKIQKDSKVPDYILLYPSNLIKHFWENVMFESISLVSYDVIAPKPYVAPKTNSTNPLGLKQGQVEYLASSLSKLKQHATQLSIEDGRTDNEI